jgi:hypothetical protein
MNGKTRALAFVAGAMRLRRANNTFPYLKAAPAAYRLYILHKKRACSTVANLNTFRQRGKPNTAEGEREKVKRGKEESLKRDGSPGGLREM